MSNPLRVNSNSLVQDHSHAAPGHDSATLPNATPSRFADDRFAQLRSKPTTSRPPSKPGLAMRRGAGLMNLQSLAKPDPMLSTENGVTQLMPLPIENNGPHSKASPLKMDPSFSGEEDGKVFGNNVNVQYLNEAQRNKLKVKVENGKITGSDGQCLDTSDVISEVAEDNHRAIYVMDKSGELYISKFKAKGFFQHSSFLSGGEVLAAGYIEIHDGIIKTLSRKSGHYKPAPENLNEVMLRLRSLGAQVHADFRIDNKI
ncbi:hypothetical protein BLA6992_06896 [Burkholderia lata]|nr:hypothetical protein BLA6992_06896 [Burkholderia lata]